MYVGLTSDIRIWKGKEAVGCGGVSTSLCVYGREIYGVRLEQQTRHLIVALDIDVTARHHATQSKDSRRLSC